MLNVLIMFVKDYVRQPMYGYHLGLGFPRLISWLIRNFNLCTYV